MSCARCGKDHPINPMHHDIDLTDTRLATLRPLIQASQECDVPHSLVIPVGDITEDAVLVVRGTPGDITTQINLLSATLSGLLTELGLEAMAEVIAAINDDFKEIAAAHDREYRATMN
jgi:hypothetical protein